MSAEIAYALVAGAGVAMIVYLALDARAERIRHLREALGLGLDPSAGAAGTIRPLLVLVVLGRVIPVRFVVPVRAIEIPEWVPDGQRPDWMRARDGWAVLLTVLVLVTSELAGAVWLPLLLLVIPFVSNRLVRAQLASIEDARRARIEREIPAALDIFVLALEAGLPFERALEAYIASARTELADELAITVRELEVGYRRREVLARLVTRTHASSLELLASRVRLAEELGSPIAATLRSLAVDLRAQRRQRLQERALRAPVTMLLPTAGFILLPIFLIVLGPIILRVISGQLL